MKRNILRLRTRKSVMPKKGNALFKPTVFIEKKTPSDVFKTTTAQKKPGPRKNG